MDAGAIKVCPKCRGAWAGNIMRCVSCGAPMPDPEPEVKNVDEFKDWRDKDGI
jgi:hypothetical protein